MQHLIQLSNFSELLNGQYEKRGTVGDVLRQANCGLGTFEGLDGELIILNGQAFKALPGGEAYELSADTPYPSRKFLRQIHFLCKKSV